LRHSARREAASQNPENPIPILTFPLKGKESAFFAASRLRVSLIPGRRFACPGYTLGFASLIASLRAFRG